MCDDRFMRHHLLSFVLLACATSARAMQPFSDPASSELQSWCHSVTRAIPRIRMKTCLGVTPSAIAARSVNERPIVLREFKPPHEAKARVLIVGGIHGDELTAVAIVFRWIELLQKPSDETNQYH